MLVETERSNWYKTQGSYVQDLASLTEPDPFCLWSLTTQDLDIEGKVKSGTQSVAELI